MVSAKPCEKPSLQKILEVLSMARLRDLVAVTCTMGCKFFIRELDILPFGSFVSFFDPNCKVTQNCAPLSPPVLIVMFVFCTNNYLQKIDSLHY